MALTYQTGEALGVKTPKLRRLRQRARTGLQFLSPWIIGFVLLKARPILPAFVFALTDFQILAPQETSFVGLSNYIRFLGDEEARISLLELLRYFLRIVPIEMIVALLLAAIFTRKRPKNHGFLRTLIFLTTIIPAASPFFYLFGGQPIADSDFGDSPAVDSVGNYGGYPAPLLCLE